MVPGDPATIDRLCLSLSWNRAEGRLTSFGQKNDKHCAMSSLAEPNERTLQALTAPVIAGLRLT
jgi:hypothetical protein